MIFKAVTLPVTLIGNMNAQISCAFQVPTPATLLGIVMMVQTNQLSCVQIESVKIQPSTDVKVVNV